jgi:hypothetical protein
MTTVGVDMVKGWSAGCVVTRTLWQGYNPAVVLTKEGLVRTYVDNSESKPTTPRLDPASACLVIGGLSALSWGVVLLLGAALYALL